MNNPTTPLRDLIESKIDEQWTAWSQRHPNLAQAIDRTRLVQVTIDKLRDDPAYIEAIRLADTDELRQEQAAELLRLAERWSRQVLFG